MKVLKFDGEYKLWRMIQKDEKAELMIRCLTQ